MEKKLMRKLYKAIKDSEVGKRLPKTFKGFYNQLKSDTFWWSKRREDECFNIYILEQNDVLKNHIEIEYNHNFKSESLMSKYDKYKQTVIYLFKRSEFKTEEAYIEKVVQFLEDLKIVEEGEKVELTNGRVHFIPPMTKSGKINKDKTKPMITIHGQEFELNTFLLSQYREEHLQDYIVFNSKKTVTFYQNFSEQSKFLKARADRNIKYVLDKNEASEFKENYFIIDKDHNAQIMDYNKVERYYNENLKKPETTGSN